MSFIYKQVIAVRTDLKMSKGKIAVQVAHGSISAYLKTRKHYPDWADKWISTGQKKVTVKVKSEEEIHELAEKARRLDIPFAIINDAGLTQLPPGTTTVIGIGPSLEQNIDKVSKELSLL
ncbi:MAG: peptidyl-tRNA hydrolase Pth2 [Candidatus Heimdallarchaeota archaeon]|nr:peptidyl-tRNA hydrolase Pth2 [Candidatus Heimdallarchaeota archaeon]MCK4972888.1 peptidyl-tRNA hydrolase Pth2 [Candidatus Heimdallarchaeota archaeon]